MYAGTLLHSVFDPKMLHNTKYCYSTSLSCVLFPLCLIAKVTTHLRLTITSHVCFSDGNLSAINVLMLASFLQSFVQSAIRLCAESCISNR